MGAGGWMQGGLEVLEGLALSPRRKAGERFSARSLLPSTLSTPNNMHPLLSSCLRKSALNAQPSNNRQSRELRVTLSSILGYASS